MTIEIVVIGLKNSPRNLIEGPIKGKDTAKIILHVTRKYDSQSNFKVKQLCYLPQMWFHV